MTPEAAVKQKVKKILDELQIYYFFPIGGAYTRPGIPDIVGCFDGRFIAIECKAGKNKTTAMQDRELEKISQANGFAMVVNETNLNELREALRCLKQTS